MSRWLHDLTAGVSIVGSMVASAAAVAVPAWLAAGAASWEWYVWVIVTPLLYLCWLVVFLAVSALICGAMGRRHPKPRHAVVLPGPLRDAKEIGGLLTAIACYRRLAILDSVPLVTVLSQFRFFRTLVLRAYSPSVHIGRNVINMGRLYDPDLTELGDGAILGGRSAVVAHSMVIRGDGALVFVSAPVKIGERATIGGEARVGLGCVVGDDAVVELGAVVEPFTRIPPGEVWGGNPARLLRRREDVQAAGPAPAETVAPAPAERDRGSDAAPSRDQARRLVVEALGLTPEDAAEDLSTATCPLWDSLGQVAIAAAIFDRYGIAVDGADVFRLKSLDDVMVAVGAAGSESPTDDATRLLRPPVGSDAPTPVLPDDLEMLPLMDSQAATRALSLSLDGTARAGTPLRVTIAASFTAQPIEQALKLWGRAFGLEIDCRFAGYGQIVQTLLDRNGPPAPSGGEVTVVLTRPEDLSPEPSAAQAELDQTVDAVEQAAARRAPDSRLLVGTLPPLVSSFTTIDRHESEAMRDRWRGRLAEIAGIELFDFSHVVERVGIENARSSQAEVHARAGYSPRLHQELAIDLVRQIVSARGRPAKVVALDCDNTLWGGVVGEVGLEGLELGPDGPGRSFQLFQQYLKRLKELGLLLVVVSRNEEHDVREVFSHHPGMVLGVEDIAAWRVNWEHKSENLRELADELNLGLDSFVLVDDDPATRMEVKTRVPEVHVVPLPDDPAAYCETLDRLWLFDGAQATAEDATRTEKARQEERRREERGSAVSLEEFLERLELEVDLRLPGVDDWPRVAQLTQRTNQFNLSLKRRTLEEVKALDAESVVLVLAARDRFGDYGSVGVCVLRSGDDPDCWELDTLLMSCRALGRGVEDAFLHGIAATAAGKGATSLVAPYLRGPRNAQIKAFLAGAGFDEIQPDLWKLPIASLPPLPRHVRLQEARAGSATTVASPVRGPASSARADRASLPVVVFDEADVALFSAASHDRNPLHLSDEYARTTPFGRPVVFGILGVLAALSRLPDDPGGVLLDVDVEFRQPLSVGVRYRVETNRTAAGTHRLLVWDAGRLAVKMTVTQGAGSDLPREPTTSPTVARIEPVDRALDELEPGTAVSGSYAPSQPSFDRLLDRWDLDRKGLGRDRLAALLWSSYLIGMELPGRRALYWSLELRFAPGVPGNQPFTYAAAVARADPQLEFAEVDADLLSRGEPWAHAKARAFVRREASTLASRARPAMGPASESHRGMVAVVIGGSRGLGAAIVQALAMNGCTVLATYLKSTEDADRVAASLADAPGTVEFIQGDAGDEAWCRDVLSRRVEQLGRLDILVCNAAPAIRPLGLSMDELARFQEFTATSLGLVAAPLAALLGPLSEHAGSCVLVSSSYVRTVPGDWPHYVAAKSAAEALIHWAAASHPQARFLVARPPRMLTDQTNTPEGRHDAIAPEQVAAAILRRLSTPSGDGVELLETFEESVIDAGLSLRG
jgi:FkbH-like protein